MLGSLKTTGNNPIKDFISSHVISGVEQTKAKEIFTTLANLFCRGTSYNKKNILKHKVHKIDADLNKNLKTKLISFQKILGDRCPQHSKAITTNGKSATTIILTSYDFILLKKIGVCVCV